jgi:hypothetical protein
VALLEEVPSSLTKPYAVGALWRQQKLLYILLYI